MENSADSLAELFATVSLGAPENAVGFVLWRVVHRYQREIDRVLVPLGLTHLQFTTLAMAGWLARSGSPTTQPALAKAGEIHPMQVSHMLKALAEKGLVTRPRNPADVRGKLVQLSDEGVTVLRAAMPKVLEVQQRMFGTGGAVGGNFLAALRQIEDDSRAAS